ncbi:22255_t:CDS:2, partial [Gigaspora margarita]
MVKVQEADLYYYNTKLNWLYIYSSNKTLIDKNTKRVKNSFPGYNNLEHYEQRNRIDIKEHTVQLERFIQKENINRNHFKNDQTHFVEKQLLDYRLQTTSNISKNSFNSQEQGKKYLYQKSYYKKNIHNNFKFKTICYNINRLKENNNKLVALVEWAIEEEIDIIDIAETNITSKE